MCSESIHLPSLKTGVGTGMTLPASSVSDSSFIAYEDRDGAMEPVRLGSGLSTYPEQRIVMDGPRPREVMSSPSSFLLSPIQSLNITPLAVEAETNSLTPQGNPKRILEPATETSSNAVLEQHAAQSLAFVDRHIHSTPKAECDAAEHILAVAPQLASIPEEGAEDDGSREETVTSTPYVLSSSPQPSDLLEVGVFPRETKKTAASPSPGDSSTIAFSPPVLSNPKSSEGAPSPVVHLTPAPDVIPNPAHVQEADEDGQVNAGDASSTESTTGEESSIFGENYHSDTSSYTASLLSDVKNYTYENGRRYHSYREGHYVLPNDEPEQDRQDLLHHVRNLVLNGALFRAPVDPNLQRALDIGTGTGIWAIDFADRYSSAEVVGTDLSPIQPSWVPPNLRFLVDDAESPWLFNASRPFDFIHARDLGGAIADWPRLLRQAYQHLRPGGWVELQEFEVTLRSDDDSLRLAPTLCEFLGRLHEASEAFHRPMNIAEGHRQRLMEAGFEEVRDEVYKV
ncbi:hypothetical protein N7462_011507 [Penicillium macrosclerotiorum]|uniref:uncharacterized protein n=1 Tax=Penicillium macrosclerotiorum TaxID=303699 RepID=UPI0025480C87|nr:uncharacterized protein N7462_011507 [Penicillium macrosclerotiorum]KAJ5664694.1 hypothetical protein N7462_011507 [Penicillium macrosclerotiorum]